MPALIHTLRAHCAQLTVLACTLLVVSLPSSAQTSESTHRYLGQALQWEPAAYMTNIKSGQSVQSPFVAKFGMSFWGIAPAEQNFPRTGHHHLLIDRDLPMGTGKPIPTDAQHVHFGKGQMEMVLNLPPGKHTLRLLLADHKHIPTYVYSREYEIQVLPGASSLPADYSKTPRLELLNLVDDETYTTPFKINFHASNLNIAALATQLPTTGHFRLVWTSLAKGRGKPELIAFPSGQTEAWFSPPEGEYELRLYYVRNDTREAMDLSSEPRRIKVKTGGSGRKQP